jgi:CheY-like chemotaxis protein
MMLTSADCQEGARRCRELGVDAYVIKPVRHSELLNLLLRVQGQKQPSRPADGESTRAAPPSPPVGAPASGLTILLAEDNLVNQRLALRLLEGMGHKVVVANDGREALAALDGSVFDLVLMDVQMPVLGGFEATARIRAREAAGERFSLNGGRLPVLALTAHAMKGDRERCLAEGMDGYLAKPIRVNELAAAIGALSSSRGVGEGQR